MTNQANGLMNHALRNARRSVDVISGNLSKSPVDGSTIKELVQSTVVSEGKVVGLTSRINRKVDLGDLGIIKDQQSNAYYHRAVHESILPLQNLINDVSIGNHVTLVAEVSDFFNTVNRAISKPHEENSKKLIVSKANSLASTLKTIAENAMNEQLKIQSKISESVDSLNSDIKNLFEINKEIVRMSFANVDVADLLDERDRLVSEISKQIPVSITYSQGSAIYLRSGSINIVSETEYGKFSFDPITNIQDIASGKKSNNLYVEVYSSENVLLQRTKYFSDYILQDKRSGNITGLIDAFDVEVPKFIKSIDALSDNIKFQLNRIHNRGGGYPGYHTITGKRAVDGSSSANWLGKAVITVVSEDGSAVKNSAGLPVPQMKLALDKLSSGNVSSSVSVREIINEINQFYYPNSSNPIMMGSEGGDESKRYLLSNFRLISRGLVNGEFRFDFEAENSSKFGSKVQILDVELNGSVNELSNEPVNLDPNSKDRTYDSSRVTFSGTGVQQMNVTVRVIGENGEIKTGKVTFEIDLDKIPEKNQRISGTPHLTDFGDIVNPAPSTSYDRFLRASLVDEKGLEIKDDFTKGYIKISTIDQSLRLIIQDHTSQQIDVFGKESTRKGFGHYFDLNNLFDENYEGISSAYTMKVREDILSYPTLLSTGIVSKSAKETEELKEGTAKAEFSVNFSNNTLADYYNSEITISGLTYFLTNGLSSEYEIDISSATSASEIVKILVSRFSLDSKLKVAFDFSQTGSKLEILAKYPGDGYNSVEASFSHATNNLFNGSNNYTNRFSGGASSNVTKERSNAGYFIGTGSVELLSEIIHLGEIGTALKGNEYILDSHSTLTRFAISVGDVLTNSYLKYRDMSEISMKALLTMQERYQEKYVADPDLVLQDLMEFQKFMSSLMKAYQKIYNMESIVYDNL